MRITQFRATLYNFYPRDTKHLREDAFYDH